MFALANFRESRQIYRSIESIFPWSRDKGKDLKSACNSVVGTKWRMDE